MESRIADPQFLEVFALSRYTDFVPKSDRKSAPPP
jgi:hypothetical protein